MKKKAKDKPHYVDNKKFLQAMIDWRETWPDEDNIPPVTNYIGECFLKIATHLSYRPNFINYTYRDEMISDGIENCLQYVKNKMIEKGSFESWTVMDGDDTGYTVSGFDPNVMLPDEDVYKPKKKEIKKTKGLEKFMEDDIDRVAIRGEER